MYPDVCEQCWEDCANPTPTPTPTPPPPTPTPTPTPVYYEGPQEVGVTQIAYDLSRPANTRHFTTAQLFDEITDYNIHIIKLWLDYNPFDGAGPFHWYSYGVYMGDLNLPTYPSGYPTGSNYRLVPMFEDMDAVWRDNRIDTIVVRFIGSGMWDGTDVSCSGWTGPFWVHEPTYDIASKLLRRYGTEDKTIIITDWEQDNQWACGGTVTEERAAERMVYVARLAEARQRAVQRARDENPDATLKLMFAMIASDFDELPDFYGMNLTKDAIPNMDPQPDMIGVSYWQKHLKTITEVAEYIQLHTGYGPERLYIDEIGAHETVQGKQYDRFMDVIPEAFDYGYAFACAWMWRQTWYSFKPNGRPLNTGMWQWAGTEGKVEWSDQPTSGLAAIQELNGDDN